MALREPMHTAAKRFRRTWPTSGAVRAATLAALLCSGVLAATALASSPVGGAQPLGSTITSATTGQTGTSSAPNRVWMTFEANPVSFVLRPLRKFAACVRKHGVPSLRDPKVVDGKVVLMLPPGLTKRSPRLKKAQRACQKLLPQGANTQPGTGTGPTTTRPGG
jgi:hypothetical protein